MLKPSLLKGYVYRLYRTLSNRAKICNSTTPSISRLVHKREIDTSKVAGEVYRLKYLIRYFAQGL